MSALAVAAVPADRELDDLDLVAGVRAGDDRAFEVLFLRYQPRIAAYVGGMVRDHGRAEDITQEVFMSALRRLREDDGQEILFRPWIYEIAKNKCIDAYRRGRHTVELSLDAHDQVGAAEHGRLAEPGATPDAAVEGKLAFDNLRGAFGGLSPVHHDILVMREFEGLSYREIGERLGMTRPAVESTLFRARKRLGEEYEELISGRRCARVQQLVDEQGAHAAGLRDQRRVARHLAHCQVCRRHAHLAGADVLAPARPASVGARVAAFLPLPAFLRRRWRGGDEAGQFLGQQAARPAAQWSAHVAGALDPGAVSTWAKAAATAATVALAGIGGSVIEHRAPAAASHAAGASGTAAAAASGEAARPARPVTAARSVATGLPLPASTQAAAAGTASSQRPQAPGTSASSGGAGASVPGTGALPGVVAPGARALDPIGAVGPAPLEPVVGAPGAAVGSVIDAIGGTTGALDARGSRSGSGDAPAADRPQRGRLLRGMAAPSAPEAPDTAVLTDTAETTDVPRRGRGLLPVQRPGGQDLPSQAAPQADAQAASSTGGVDSVGSTVTGHLPNASAPRTSLAG
jgi:RNA polymerase sigma factor (sigma-70 family)